MFSLVDESILWNLQSDSVKIRDLSTTQVSYLGENCGQTQRYLIALGRLVESLFDETERLYSWGNAKTHPDEFLDKLLALYGMNFFDADLAENAQRELLDEAIWFWKLKGTVIALRWITWKVFGWEVESIDDPKELVVQTNLMDHHIYDNTETLDESMVLYSKRIINFGDIVLRVDVKSDVDFATKKDIFERLCDVWGYTNVTDIIYINTP